MSVWDVGATSNSPAAPVGASGTCAKGPLSFAVTSSGMESNINAHLNCKY